MALGHGSHTIVDADLAENAVPAGDDSQRICLPDWYPSDSALLDMPLTAAKCLEKATTQDPFATKL